MSERNISDGSPSFYLFWQEVCRLLSSLSRQRLCPACAQRHVDNVDNSVENAKNT
jgi:hypothetical protein